MFEVAVFKVAKQGLKRPFVRSQSKLQGLLEVREQNMDFFSEKNKNLFFKSALLIYTVSTNTFHSTNFFCCFFVTRHQPIA